MKSADRRDRHEISDGFKTLFSLTICHAANSEHFDSEKSTCTCNNNNQYLIRMGMPNSGIVTCNYVLTK